MDFSSFFSGTPGGFQQVSTKTPQQSQFMNQLLQQLGPQASQSFDFQPIAQAATRRFNEQTLPSIAERFAGMNAKRSSGYGQALANAQGGLQEQLAGQQAQFGLQSQSNLSRLLGLGLGPQFENKYVEGEESPFASILPFLLHAGAALGTGGASVPFSAAMMGAGGADTSGIQSWIGNLFGGGKGGGQSQGGSPTTNTMGQVPIRQGGYAGMR